VQGEGMPIKRSERKGDLYLIAKVDFPRDGWLEDDAAYDALQGLLPAPEPAIVAEEVDEVEFEADVDIEQVIATA